LIFLLLACRGGGRGTEGAGSGESRSIESSEAGRDLRLLLPTGHIEMSSRFVESGRVGVSQIASTVDAGLRNVAIYLGDLDIQVSIIMTMSERIPSAER
jgi:hypothetical protein